MGWMMQVTGPGMWGACGACGGRVGRVGWACRAGVGRACRSGGRVGRVGQSSAELPVKRFAYDPLDERELTHPTLHADPTCSLDWSDVRGDRSGADGAHQRVVAAVCAASDRK